MSFSLYDKIRSFFVLMFGGARAALRTCRTMYGASTDRHASFLVDNVANIVYNEELAEYVRCDQKAANLSGAVQLTHGGYPTGIYVNVRVFPKRVTCVNGHTFDTTKEAIELYKTTNQWGAGACPYCKAYVKTLAFSQTTVSVPVGTHASHCQCATGCHLL